MTSRNPVEFTDTQKRRVGNKVLLSDINGNPIAPDNPQYTQIQSSDSPSIDAFGRWRVSDTGNRFDVEFIYNLQPDIIDTVITGSSAATHNDNGRDVTLAIVDTTVNDLAALYSYDVPYTPGSGQLIDITGTLNNAGIANSETFLFLRSKVTGSIVETTYAQSEWNKNTAQDVDWSKSQILAMDFQSLKIGRIRFYLVRNGLPVTLHEIYNDNIRTTGYWQLPSLPVYWRIYNDASYTYTEMGYGDSDNAIGIKCRVPLNATATMRAICATVKSEGGDRIFDLSGYPRAIDIGATAKTVSTSLIPLLSIRPRALFSGIANRGLYIPKGFTILGNNPLRYVIVYRPTLTNASWVNVDTNNSGIEYDISATAITGGIIIDADYLSSDRNSASVTKSLLGKSILRLGRTGTSDILALAAVRTSTSDSATYAAFKWEELR